MHLKPDYWANHHTSITISAIKTAHWSLHTCTLHTASTLYISTLYISTLFVLPCCSVSYADSGLTCLSLSLLYYTILYYTLLYHYFPLHIFTVLYYTVLYYTVLYFTISLLPSPYIYWLLLKTRFQIKWNFSCRASGDPPHSTMAGWLIAPEVYACKNTKI